MKATLVLATVTLALASPTAAQHPERWALAVELGIEGPGIAVAHRVADRLDLRAGYSGIATNLEGDDTVDLGDVPYRPDFDLSAAGLYLDRYLGETQFRLSVGAVYVDDRIELAGALQSGKSYPIGDGSYTAAEIGELTGRTSADSLGAYLGVGWGDPFAGSSRWRFRADLGVIYRDAADVVLHAGNPGGLPELDADVDREAADLRDDIGRLRPVLSVGVSYRF